MTTRQISETIHEIYGFEASEGFISDVTDKILPQIEEWQNRSLGNVYPIVFIDAIHFSVRQDSMVSKLAAYVVVGINNAGRKEVLTVEIGENESSKYWFGEDPIYRFFFTDPVADAHDGYVALLLLGSRIDACREVCALICIEREKDLIRRAVCGEAVALLRECRANAVCHSDRVLTAALIEHVREERVELEPLAPDSSL